MTETLAMPTQPYDPSSSVEAYPAAAPTLLQRLLRDSAYNVTAFVIALPAFVVAVVALSVGAGTLVIGVGLLVLVAGVFLARGLAHLERLRLRTLLDRDAPTPAYAVARPDASPVRRVLTPLADPQSWLDLLWALVGFATGTAAFAVTVGWWAGTAGGLTYWFWQRWLPIGDDTETLAHLIGFGAGRQPEIWLNTAFGVAGLLLLPVVVRLMALVHGSLSWALLSGRARLQEDVREAEGGRRAARSAEATSLRRLERDIHDGPQQRLVRLQMDLGRAGKQIDTDPEQARTTIAGALDQAREAVAELRALSRGIAPPVLVDRGLAAALEEAFDRSPVPVRASVALPDAMPPEVETTAYFVVAEALTNVAKHSEASAVDVTVRERDGVLRIQVTDDGVGGADLGRGHGLAGLDERLRGAAGTLRLASPAGGPTSLVAEVPCG